MNPEALTRRDFLALPGLFVLIAAEPAYGFQEPERLPTRPSYPTDCNAYLRIAPDGGVTCLVGKVELGQGSKTSLAQLLAEELDVALERVEMIMGDTDLCPWDVGTFGSLGIRQFGPVLRAAGAEARATLIQMAAERLGAPAARLKVKAGVVTDPSSGKRVSYGELVAGKRIERRVEKAQVKAPRAFTIVGQAPRRKDALDKVTGKARYAADMTLPGTLHARILRPPSHSAALKSADTAAAEKIAGVRVIRDGDLIAVLHEKPDVAEKALRLIRAQFERSDPAFDDKSVFAHLKKAAPPGQEVRQTGSLAEGEKLASTMLEAEYWNSYVAHAPIETHSAVARVEGGTDRMGRHASAILCEAASRRGARLRPAERAGDHAVRRRGIRR